MLRHGTGYQVSGTDRHIGLGKFAVLAQVIRVVVVVVDAAAAATCVICSEISLTVFVMIVQKHLGHCALCVTDTGILTYWSRLPVSSCTTS